MYGERFNRAMKCKCFCKVTRLYSLVSVRNHVCFCKVTRLHSLVYVRNHACFCKVTRLHSLIYVRNHACFYKVTRSLYKNIHDFWRRQDCINVSLYKNMHDFWRRQDCVNVSLYKNIHDFWRRFHSSVESFSIHAFYVRNHACFCKVTRLHVSYLFYFYTQSNRLDQVRKEGPSWSR
jgi:hypothetical protein